MVKNIKDLVLLLLKRLCSAAQTTHCKLIFLPPYSTERSLNEKFWPHLKQGLRNILPFSPSLDDALHAVLNCGNYSKTREAMDVDEMENTLVF